MLTGSCGVVLSTLGQYFSGTGPVADSPIQSLLRSDFRVGMLDEQLFVLETAVWILPPE